jgi:hypothetical protein
MEIKFNKLKISDDRLSLDIDIDLVNSLGESYVIKSVTIDDQSTYRGNRDNKPSGKPLFYVEVGSTSYKATLYKEDMISGVSKLSHIATQENYYGWDSSRKDYAIEITKDTSNKICDDRADFDCTPCEKGKTLGTFANNMLVVYVEYGKISGESTDGRTWNASVDDVPVSNPSDTSDIRLSVVGQSSKFAIFDANGGEHTIHIEAIGGGNTPSISDGYVVGITIDWKGFYDLSMSYIKQMLRAGCDDIPYVPFMDYILKNDAIKFAIECGDLNMAIDLWKRTFINSGAKVATCNCR